MQEKNSWKTRKPVEEILVFKSPAWSEATSWAATLEFLTCRNTTSHPGLSYLHGDYYGMCASRRSRPTDSDVSMTKPRLYASRRMERKKRGTERAAGQQIIHQRAAGSFSFRRWSSEFSSLKSHFNVTRLISWHLKIQTADFLLRFLFFCSIMWRLCPRLTESPSSVQEISNPKRANQCVFEPLITVLFMLLL